MRRGRAATYALLAPPLAVFLGLYLLPLANLFVLSFFGFDRVTGTLGGATLVNYTKVLGDAFYLEVLWRTMRLGLLTTATALVLGYPVAYVLARARGRRRAYLMLGILAPLLVSVVVRTFN